MLDSPRRWKRRGRWLSFVLVFLLGLSGGYVISELDLINQDQIHGLISNLDFPRLFNAEDQPLSPTTEKPTTPIPETDQKSSSIELAPPKDLQSSGELFVVVPESTPKPASSNRGQ